MIRDANLYENKKTQELIEAILRLFPNAKIIETRKVGRLGKPGLYWAAREGSGREPARAGGQGRWRGSCDLYGINWDHTGGGT
jgi:hypothetical protein